MYILGLLLAACGDPSLLPVEAAGPAPALVVSPLVAGHAVVVEAWGGAGRAHLFASTRAGQGPCAPGGCLGLRGPRLLDVDVADASGYLRLEATVPAAPQGTPVFLQVAWLDAGGAVHAVSSVVQAAVGADPLAASADGFEHAASIGEWSLLSDVEGPPVLHDRVEIDGVEPGALAIEPNGYDEPTLNDGGAGPGWFQDRKGPYLFREVSGDFSARVRLRIGRRDDMSQPPGGSFQAAGFVLRDPTSTAPLGDERWLMYNLGWQDRGLAFELKTTFPDGPDADLESQSTLMLDPASARAATLVACRVGDMFRFWRRLDGEADWTEQLPDPSLVYHDGAGVAWGDFATDGFLRSDLPDTLQVGLMAGVWSQGPAPAIRGAFDEFWLGTPVDEEDCLRAPVAP